MEFTAAGYLELIGAVALLNPQRDVVNKLALKALLDITRSDVLALTPCKRRVVDLKGHAHSRLVDG